MASPQDEAAKLLAEYDTVNPKNTYLLNEPRIQALQQSRQDTLASMDANVVTDSDPIYKMITDQGEKAFNLIQDEEGQDVYICSNDTAAFWVYAKDGTSLNPQAPQAAESGTGPTVEVGMMTLNGGQASVCILDQLWDIKDHIALGALATGIGAVVGKQITAALTKRAAEAAEIVAAGVARDDAYKILRAAHKSGNADRISSAVKRLKDARSQVDNLWMKNLPKGTAGEKLLNLATKYPKLSGFLGGTIVTIVLTIAFEVLWHFINKDLFISARIYNWDVRTWEIDDWYHDNGILVGGGEFEKKQIVASPTAKQKTPWGDKLGKWKPATFVEYNFQNSFTVLDGIGIALRARSIDGKNGLAMGYLCSFTKDNQLTIKDGYPSSIKDFYWDNSQWPTDRPLKVECQTDGGDGKRIKVTADTSALNGAKDNTYNYTVNIGDPGR